MRNHSILTFIVNVKLASNVLLVILVIIVNVAGRQIIALIRKLVALMRLREQLGAVNRHEPGLNSLVGNYKSTPGLPHSIIAFYIEQRLSLIMNSLSI